MIMMRDLDQRTAISENTPPSAMFKLLLSTAILCACQRLRLRLCLGVPGILSNFVVSFKIIAAAALRDFEGVRETSLKGGSVGCE